LDGKSHFEVSGKLYDEQRDNYLAGLGLRVLRFENRELFENPERVLDEMKGSFMRVAQRAG